MKGGYKIIDFKNVSLSGTPVTMTDVLVDLLNNYDKVVLLSNVVLSGSAKDDCFSTVLSDGDGGVKLNCYDGYISINSSGAVTYTVASASGMASDLANIFNMIAPAWSVTETYTINSIVRDGGKLYKAKSNVPIGTVTSNTTYWGETTEAYEIKFLNDLFILRLYTYNFTYEAGTIGSRAANVSAPENYTIQGYKAVSSSTRSTTNSSAYWGDLELTTGQLKVYRASDQAISEGQGQILKFVLYMKE